MRYMIGPLVKVHEIEMEVKRHSTVSKISDLSPKNLYSCIISNPDETVQWFYRMFIQKHAISIIALILVNHWTWSIQTLIWNYVSIVRHSSANDTYRLCMFSGQSIGLWYYRSLHVRRVFLAPICRYDVSNSANILSKLENNDNVFLVLLVPFYESCMVAD